ncbi:MAG TPA: right-handed parallel beta-helix repeat-containing protein, partial [Thermoplasmata archaeon]|nr:right-handed parallel beta-helix repeat-containing protein [Thermoplasmata archaeon]
VRLEALEFYSALEAVLGTSVANLTVVDSEIGGGWGFSLFNASRVLFQKNAVLWTAYGIRLVDSDNATIRENRFANHGGGGVFLESSENVVVDSNSFAGPYGGGVVAVSSRRGLVVNNTFRDQSWAATLRDSVEFTFHHNEFRGNEVAAQDSFGPENVWDDGYPSGGNYWSEYVGEDRFRGPNQNLPGSDGIGDTPYRIDADSVDRYPLYWHPVERPPVKPPIVGL